MNSVLPEPARERWQPLRAGLIDLFYYDTEEFWFRDGRLLLRGNNGTGKSKVLALTLPFLLDGDLSPHRVEPDADPKKRMEWNLLLGGAHPYPERLGYTWIEFGRVDDHGEQHFRTLGCGLKAVSGRGVARNWFFVTSRRVGVDLALVDATGTALTRDRLIDALSDLGTVYDRARDYRRAVDECLFGFGEQRYGALVELLIRLRQPQLSKKPSEKALSDALTDALPPLDQAVIADVAEAFRSLEEDRDALRAMTDARDAATSFLSHYRRYAQIAARQRSRLPRDAQSSYERTNRDLTAAEADQQRAEQALAAAKERQLELSAEQRRLRSRDEALRASPDMRSARELERAADDARRLDEEAGRAGGERDLAARTVAVQQERQVAAVARLDDAEQALLAARRATAEAAAGALIGSEHDIRVDRPLDAAPAAAGPDLAAVRRDAEQVRERQRRATGHVTGLIDTAEAASARLSAARQKVADLDAEADELAGRRADAGQVVAGQGAALVASVRDHLAATAELQLADPATTISGLELWVETLDGPNPAAAAVSAAAHASSAALATADAGLETRLRAARLRRTELTDEITRLERGEDALPPVPHTRGAAARDGRPGAPLWQLIDFLDEVGHDDRAGVEAALEAAGVLDAWLTPAGDLVSAGSDDVVLRATDPVPVSVGRVLRPSVYRENPLAATVTDEMIAAVLASIGLVTSPEGGGGSTWVATDGRFGIGVVEGSWHKPAATFIGRGAREAARRSRLAELRTGLEALDAELTEIAVGRDRLAARRSILAEEVATVPDDAALRQAHALVVSLGHEQARLLDRREAARQSLSAATAADEGAATALAEGARDVGLPADRAELARIAEALADYQVRLAEMWPAVEAVQDRRRRVAEVADDLEVATARLAEQAERAEEIAGQAAAAQERHQTLLGTVGAAVADLQRQLTEVGGLVAANETAQRAAVAEAERAIDARGRAQGRLDELTEQLTVVTGERAAAAEAFRRFAATGLLTVALPHLDTPDPDRPWAPDPTVRLARKVNEDLSEIGDDDSAWERAQQRVNSELKALHDTLSRHGNRASADLREGGVVVEVEFQGRPASVPELSTALESEVADRERLLNEREREILENHLVNEVASTLQELITTAESQVQAMNDELEARPTSTGMRLRLQWRPREDGPPGLAEARERLLRQTADAWSTDDQAALGAFLQTRIAEVRARNDTGTWLEHLTEALDYRTWNRFIIQRHQNGRWQPATGPASGGERVLAASVPLFAAASSHYASAGSPYAPRLVTLDEAFAGVDDNARAKYLGLLAAFDLDVVMTSEREWGCYPEVPGLAISQLARTDDVAAVLVTSWEWDGARRARVDREVRAIRDSGAESPATPQDGLWA